MLSSVVDVCFESEDTFDEVQDLVEIPLEWPYAVFKHEEPTSLVCPSVLPKPLDYSHTSPLCSLSSPPPKYYFDAPIGNLMIFADMDWGYENNMFSMRGGMLMIIWS